MPTAVDALPSNVLDFVPEPFSTRLKSLFAMDCVRVMRLAESAQWVLVYTALALPLGVVIDYLCEAMYPPEAEEKMTMLEQAKCIGAVLIQAIVNCVVIFYIRKIAALCPMIYNACPSSYVPRYHVDEMTGEIALGVVFVCAQTTFMAQIARLRTRWTVDRGVAAGDPEMPRAQ